MNDSTLVRKSQQIDGHLNRIREIVSELETSDDPHTQMFYQFLDDNGLTAFAWASGVHNCLRHPENWETGSWGIRRRVQP